MSLPSGTYALKHDVGLVSSLVSPLKKEPKCVQITT